MANPTTNSLIKSDDVMSVANGGTGRSTLTTTDTTNYTYRAISIQTSVPESVDQGCIVFVVLS